MSLKDCIIHHIGYVTKSIDHTADSFKIMGYSKGVKVFDPIQNVNICFIKKHGSVTIELVEPADERSSVNKMLKNMGGVSPYHICYQVHDVDVAYNELVDNEGFTPLFRPVEATAMDNKLICYLYKREIGYIELVNE
ncbi:MAG TPA: VOC family protein [Candidatus Egerieousia sp.]|nr:VOC family protein [Candidatus Egerieousia sp.]